MGTINIILIVLSILIIIISFLKIRNAAKYGERAPQSNINTTFLILISILLVLVFNIPFPHVIWMLIASIIVGHLSKIFPFILISIPAAYLIERIAYIGLNHQKILETKYEIEDTLKDIAAGKLTQEEATKKLLEKAKKKNQNIE
jgi:hypothetical protein